MCLLSTAYVIPLRWKRAARPVWVDQWPLPLEKLKALRQLISQEFQLGHIEPSLSQWNTPIFVIQKRSGAFHLLHDSRAVNAQLVPFGAVQQSGPVLSAIPKEWPLVVIDLKDCFFSIPLVEEDQEASAFTVLMLNNLGPTERFQWRVLPQGMACSPTICQLVVGRVLEPVRRDFPRYTLAHYMDDLLLAAPTALGLQTLESRVMSTLTAAGFTISEQKIQRGLGVEYLGYRFGPETVQPVGLIIQLHVKTLWDVQKLVGALQWVRGALGIPPRLMKPFYDQLKGSDLKEPRDLTHEMATAWQEILQNCMEHLLTRWDPTEALEAAVCRCEAGAAAVLGHSLDAKPQPLWWLFSVQPMRAYASWIEILVMLLRKTQLLSVRL